MGHKTRFLLKHDAVVVALLHHVLDLAVAADTTSWPHTLRTCSISSSSATRLCRQSLCPPSGSSVRSAVNPQLPALTGQPVHKLRAAQQFADHGVRYSALPHRPRCRRACRRQPRQSSHPSGSGWTLCRIRLLLFRNSFWLRLAENSCCPWHVLSQLRMMSAGSAFRLRFRIAFQLPDAVRHLVNFAHLQRIAYLDVHLPGSFTLRLIL